ncbi:MAG: PaaI family thioesterase [Rhodospirillaceae bacterium]|nr:PaaI family thioesterase [Rhodospirillaceae bacterium]
MAIKATDVMTSSDRPSLITTDEFHADTGDRHWFGTWLGGRVVELGWGTAKMELDIREEFLREGGTVAGPIIMGAADMVLYAAVMSAYEKGRKSVTADMTMHFLRRPTGKMLKAHAIIIKFGRRLAMGRIEVMMDDDPRMVAHVAATYALP